ncbi:MAG TPA: Gfo/Idh/MocA family oxidoreductase [Candidatus Udaeobacter sp.]|nr:Gfo/Idh/MocA family oxidoreductase [Candidatus Udaeobacter sp.]
MAWASISEPKAPPGKRTEAVSGVWGEGLAVKENKAKIRYAVVGLGHIAQVAVLPAFAHASRNSALAALVSDNPKKLKQLSRLYGIGLTYSYEQYDDCLQSGEIDAVYIALPNSMHADYALRAANAGIHVLCEKPMAVTEKECAAMIRATDKNHVKLMIAYRLHFEEANLKAVEVVRSGKLGEPRIFNSVFGMQVREGNIRIQAQLGGGTLYDLGIYCINAARFLFQDEPLEAFAWSATNADARFSEVDEMTSAVLRFPKDRLAVFTSSFGSADIASYQIIGTRGDLRVDPAYEYAMELGHHLTIEGKTRSHTFAKRDQFAPELLYFSDCIANDRKPEPSGEEGLADVRIIRALYRSAQTGRPVKLQPTRVKKRPSLKQEKRRPPVAKPQLVNAESASV